MTPSTCFIEFKDLELNKETFLILSEEDSLLVIEKHKNDTFLTGVEFSLLCIYNPEIFLSINLNGVNHRYEFCLDCGQGKYFLNNVEKLSSFFTPSRDFLYNISEKYFKTFNRQKYKD
jgi:hypothetical protein